MEDLVNEKVDAFWRGSEGGAKKGQVRSTNLHSPTWNLELEPLSWWADHSDILGTETEEIVVPGVHGGGGGSLGAMVCLFILMRASRKLLMCVLCI